MPDLSFSNISTRSLRRLMAVFAVLSFAACQIVCMSHFHCLELSHFDHHHHAPFGHDVGHADEHEQSGCEDSECTFTDIPGHSSPDHTITPTRLALWWPEIGIDCVEVPVSMGSSRAAEHPSTGCTRSLVDRHGFTFIGRSPTAS